MDTTTSSTMQRTLVSVAVLLAVVSWALSDFFIHGPQKHVKVHIELLPDGAVGPESIAFDANGDGPYTGVSDGRILKWQGKEQGWLEYATVYSPEMLSKCKGSKDPKIEDSCGRPLGLQFSESQDLYIADAYFGLLVTNASNKFANTLVDQAEGFPLRFTNGLDIDHKTGLIYFTDSSLHFQRREFMRAILSGDKTGRLMVYDPRRNEAKVMLDGLSFPNGVAVSKDGSFLLVSETATCRVLRYWLDDRTGPNDERFEVVAQLPGFPDNVKRSPRGGFWVALHSRRGRLVEWALSHPWLRGLLLGSKINLHRLISLLSRWSTDVTALRLSEDGDVLEMVGGLSGSKVRFISEVEEKNGSLWLGSVVMPFFAVVSLDDVVAN